MKKGLVFVLAVVLCALPVTLSARTHVNFSILFDVAGMMNRPRYVPMPPPPVVERRIYVPVHPYYVYPAPVYRDVVVPYYPCLPLFP